MSKFIIALISFCFGISQVYANHVPAKNYIDVKNFLHELVRSHPDVASSVIVGPSDSGEMIEGIKIGRGERHTLVVGTHHGNEYGSTEVAMAFAASIADKPIAEQTVYIIPVLNISGYNSNNREELDANKVSRDPNRDYPGPCGTSGPHHLKSTASLAKFIEQENIITSATLHTYYPAVTYPWGITTYNLSTPYDAIFKNMVNNATEISHYSVGNSSDVIYPANGAYEDYAFWKLGVWSILFELGHSHMPSTAEIDEMIRVNVPGLRKMLELSPHERADNHGFTGHCEARLARFDRRDE